jgi:hypothetical protein
MGTTKKELFFRNNTTGYNTTTINYSGYGYGRQYAGMTNVYGYDNDGIRFDYIVTSHREKVILRMLKDGSWWLIDSSIRGNYSTNGKTTLCGIERSKKHIERLDKIAHSHFVNTDRGIDAHNNRVRIRN